MPTILILIGPIQIPQENTANKSKGRELLLEYEKTIKKHFPSQACNFVAFQSDNENELIACLKNQTEGIFLMLFPGILAASGIELKQAIQEINIPFLEIHNFNETLTEKYIHQSIFTDLSEGTLVGLGLKGIVLGAQYAVDYKELQSNAGI